ncbi:MAG: lytic murein transglycosylase B [Cellvibrionales bacterium]|nr:lytic murein transglycosylase B [Cellvibrionales bacterium]
MKVNVFWVGLIAGVFWLSTHVSAGDKTVDENKYANDADIKAFAKEHAKKHKKDEQKTYNLLRQAKYKQSIIDAISRPAEFTHEWKDYAKIFLKEKRLAKGVEFWKKHQKVINEVSKKYGVEPEIILAIIGVETWYGSHMGDYRVLDALVTLGFDYPKRGKFFKKELEEYLLLLDEQRLDGTKLKGSYAGAMGFGQFIPSSYRAYAKSYDGIGAVDIWNDPKDAIASVANYLKMHGWRYGDLVADQIMTTDKIKDSLISEKLKLDKSVKQLRMQKVNVGESISADADVMLMKMQGQYGEEYWVGFKNFYVITRYNRSTMYSLAVYQLAQMLKYEMTLVK